MPLDCERPISKPLEKRVLNYGNNIIMICNKSFNLFGSPIGETKQIGYWYFGEKEFQKIQYMSFPQTLNLS
jgi:hypothetical protein